MIDHATQIVMGGVLALLIIREVFVFIVKIRDRSADTGDNGRRRATTDPLRGMRKDVEAVLLRLDRIIERLEELSEETKCSRRQSEITFEQAERMTRAVSQLETVINEAALRRRSTETNPGL